MTPTRATRRHAAMIAAVVVGFQAGLVVLDGRAVVWWSDLGSLAAIGLAAAALSWRTNRVPQHVRWTWAWTAASCWSWFVGHGLWSYQQLAGDEAVPFPSIADVFFFAAVPLAAVAVFSQHGRGTVAGSRALLDVLLGGTSTVVATWAVLLAAAPEVLEERTVAELVGIAHPVAHVALAALFGLAGVRSGDDEARSLCALGASWGVLGLASVGYGVLVVQGRYETGHWIDGVYVLAFALLAAVALRRPSGPLPRGSSHKRLAVALPYAPLAIALAAAATGRVHPDAVLTWSVYVLVAVVLVRQYLTLVENQALARDLEARVAARTSELAVSEARYRNALAASGVGSFEFDARSRRMFLSLQAEAIHGIEPGTFSGDLEELRSLVHPEDRGSFRHAAGYEHREAGEECTFVYRTVHAGGTVRWAEARGSLRIDGDRRTVVGIITDITERKQAEAELDRLASSDALTGLPNRSRLLAMLGSSFDRSCPVALLMMDLDGFKEVNDGLGHDTGDQLLVEVASRLRSSVRRDDLVARLGGDEFAIALFGEEAAAAASTVAEQLLTALGRPVEVAGLRLPVGASIGIALAPQQASSPAELLRHADVAMYRAKLRRGTWAMFDSAVDDARTGHLSLLADLRAAIDDEAIEVHYQPQVDLRTGRIVAVEALARWHHPARGAVAPSEFIPLAEHSGLIRDLTPLVVRQALDQCRRWRTEGFDLQVAVNISPRLLDDEELPEWIDRALLEARVAPGALTVEITEDAFADETPLVERTIEELCRLGVRLSVDDFGTGYSSLGYLRRLPVDDVKIDRTFIAGLPGHADTGIVRAVLELGRHLGITVVAEGVEHEATLELLRTWGCGIAQGYLIARPQPAAALTALLSADAQGWVVGSPA